jgi:uncharacterized protein
VLRVLVDPGVLVAALISREGAPARLLRLWLDGAFDLIVSPALLAELEDVLRRPKFRPYFTVRQAAALVALLRERGVFVPDPQEVVPVSRDPGDDYLLALGAESADVLVSGDSDLTNLADAPIGVLTPRQILSRLEKRS